MRAEIISIGDELTSGERLDTNSQWLSQRLGDLGVPVVAHVTVADDLAANIAVFRQAIERAEVVISTGGLGPTADDLTREVLAQVMGTPLELREPELAHLRGLFARRKREMPQRNIVQAMFPVGSRSIPNPEGTAPGISVAIPRTRAATSHVYALPGVPAEMRQMWEQSVMPALVALGAGCGVIRHKQIKCFGVGESDLEQMLPDLIRRGREPSVGITVHEATITLRITASGPDAAACFASMEPTLATIHKCLGKLVFGEDDDELQHVVLRKLSERRHTLATVECGSAGLLARWLGEADAGRGAYRGGLVLPSVESLTRLAGVPPDLISDKEAVRAMATRCREQFGADYGLAIGPFPRHEPRGDEPGLVHFAVADALGCRVKAAAFAGHSAIVNSRATKQALDMLRLEWD